MPYSGKTEYLKCAKDQRADSIRLYNTKGYVLLGEASFEANAANYEKQLRAKASELNADIVLTTSSFAGTRNIVIPLTTYEPGQVTNTYSTGQINATAYGSNGSSAYTTGQYSGTSTSISSGTTSTTYLPMQITRNSYWAAFLRKNIPLFGVFYLPLTDNERILLQRNTGVKVTTIVDESPAYYANILPGDYIITFNNTTVTTPQMLHAITEENLGKEIKLGIIRNGQNKEISLKLNNYPSFTKALSN